MPLEALIFDVDGTLAETEEAHRRALNETFEAFGLTWNWDQATYRRLLRIMGGKERLQHFIEHDEPEGAQEALEMLPIMHAAKNERYGEFVRAGAVSLRPGVKRLIGEARAAGVRLAIATTTSLGNVETLLRQTLGYDAPDMFEAIAAGDRVALKKPAPDTYLLALEQLALDPARALALEDTVYGVRSAAAAGLKCVVTPSFYSDDQDFSQAAAVFDSFGEPELPARWIAGAGRGERMVTIEFLRKLVA